MSVKGVEMGFILLGAGLLLSLAGATVELGGASCAITKGSIEVLLEQMPGRKPSPPRRVTVSEEEIEALGHKARELELSFSGLEEGEGDVREMLTALRSFLEVLIELAEVLEERLAPRIRPIVLSGSR